jgi:glycosyltransferase involved in cell wall biosynthesis
MELVERVNKGEQVDSDQLAVYLESSNSAEKFLANHAAAMLDLRRAQQHMLQSLDAIDYSDQKVLNQFVSVSGFLGLADARTEPVVKFGACAIARREFSLGLEAIASAVSYDFNNDSTYTSNRENAQFIASQYERAAQAIGFAGGNFNYGNPQRRIAYVTSNIDDTDSVTRSINGISKHLNGQRFKLFVYSTECGVRREKQQFASTTLTLPSTKRGQNALENLGQKKISTWLSPLDGDLVSSATALANQLLADKIDVVFFDASLNDAVASVIANWEVAPVKINLVRKTALFVQGINSVVYFDKNGFESDKDFWAKRNVSSRFITEGMDVEEFTGTGPLRSSYGIPENAVVLATSSSDLDTTIDENFSDTIVNVLRAHPNAVYLLIGEGDLAWQKRKFESAGVGKRVGYAGRRKDMPGFLRIADVYLSEFNSSSGTGVLQAMSLEKPVVATTSGEGQSSFAGEEATVSGDAYIERVSKLIRDGNYRKSLGRNLRQRLESSFGYNQTVRVFEEIVDSIPAPSQEHAPFAQAA